MDEVIQRQQQRIFKRSALAAAALLLLAGLVMSVIWMKQSAPLLTFQHTQDAVFQITHAQQDDSSYDSDELTVGSRLRLSQGTMELTFKSGVQAIVRAPADLGLLDKNRIAQNEGIVHYIVPPSAIGFQVQTPDLLVTDLGTEFGVISSQDQPNQVHLFKGKMEIESRKHLKETELLTGIESRIIGPVGRFSAIDSSPELFKTSLEEIPPYLHLSFDQLEREQLKISGNLPQLEELSAELVKGQDTPDLVPGKFGDAVEFNGQGGYVQTNWEGISGSTPRSVAFWCKLPELDKGTKSVGLVAWGDHRTLGKKFVVVTNRDLNAGQRGAIRFDSGRGYAIGETNLMDGEWHHIAVVMGGQIDSAMGVHVQLYVDGEREELTGALPNNPETTAGTDNASWMSLGRYRLSGMPNHNVLTGSLDELYVFSGFLTRADIRQIMQDEWVSDGAPRQ